jgi:hypothetical protein
MPAGDDQVKFDNTHQTHRREREAMNRKRPLTFLGSALPKEHHSWSAVLRRGGHTPEHIKIADAPGGAAIVFDGDSGQRPVGAFHISATYLSAYAPTGSGPRQRERLTSSGRQGCASHRMSAQRHRRYDAHPALQKWSSSANNHIIGSRMGAFFLAEFCQNATITGNLVDGTNGSRVVSVEKSCTDVTMTGNTFRNGGRGAWINQPVNFVMTGNVFVNNTTKNEPDMRRGRIGYRTGEAGDSFPNCISRSMILRPVYGPIMCADNIFHGRRLRARGSGDVCAEWP